MQTRRELERNKINVTHFLAIIERAVPSSYEFRLLAFCRPQLALSTHPRSFDDSQNRTGSSTQILPSNMSIAVNMTTLAGDIRNTKTWHSSCS